MQGIEILPFVLPLLSGQTTEFAVAGDAEAEAGSIPQSGTTAVQPGVQGVLALITGMRVLSERTTFLLNYEPQLLFQIPGTIVYGRPLFFNRIRSSYGTALDKRTALGVTLNAGGGEASYSSLQQVFDPGSGTVDASVSTIVYGDGQIGLDHRTSRLNSVGVAFAGGYRGPWKANEELAEGETPTAQQIPKSLNASLTLSDIYDFSLRDRGTASLRAGYLNRLEDDDEELDSDAPAATVNQINELVALGGTFAWSRTLSASSAMNYSAGMAFTYALDEPEDADRLGFVPNATAGYVNNWRTSRWVWNSSVSGGVRGFLDRVSATYRPQGFVNWSLNGAVGRDWRTGLSAFVSTSLSTEPLDPPQYESTFSLEAPTTYRVAHNATLRFGLRMRLRGPHLSELGDKEAEDPLDDSTTTQPTVQALIVGFVGFHYVLGSGESRGAWL